MKIKFETEDECYCVTPCPYGFTDGYTGEQKKGWKQQLLRMHTL